mmetsp:Transcript_18225/g.56386  ORF Transcript_18225/g.56386 Transcript_18225/m.56386 type:complete len:232 (-) Transcript_18225:377-1072(-)
MISNSARGAVATPSSGEATASAPAARHCSRSLSPSAFGRSSTGMLGKPQLRVRNATRRSAQSELLPRRCTGSLSPLLMTSTACAPAPAAMWALTAKGASSPAGPPRRTSAIFPRLRSPARPMPYSSSASKTTLPAIVSPLRSAFHRARCARTVSGAAAGPWRRRTGCRSCGCGSRAFCSSASRRRSRRSSSSSIMVMSGTALSMTASTSSGARGEMWIVATRKSSLSPQAT